MNQERLSGPVEAAPVSARKVRLQARVRMLRRRAENWARFAAALCPPEQAMARRLFAGIPSMRLQVEYDQLVPFLHDDGDPTEIVGHYQSFSVDWGEARAEHISSEMGFMEVLLSLEAEALTTRDRGTALLARGAQATFLRECLSATVMRAWHAALSGLPSDSPYRRLLAEVLSLLRAEMRRLHVLPSARTSPSLFESQAAPLVHPGRFVREFTPPSFSAN
ncbi:MAG: hypothetical protein ACYCW6_09760 [Candidatus Xenobia bacterium]